MDVVLPYLLGMVTGSLFGLGWALGKRNRLRDRVTTLRDEAWAGREDRSSVAYLNAVLDLLGKDKQSDV